MTSSSTSPDATKHILYMYMKSYSRSHVVKLLNNLISKKRRFVHFGVIEFNSWESTFCCKTEAEVLEHECGVVEGELS